MIGQASEGRRSPSLRRWFIELVGIVTCNANGHALRACDSARGMLLRQQRATRQ
jgi:hypothetical protein